MEKLTKNQELINATVKSVKKAKNTTAKEIVAEKNDFTNDVNKVKATATTINNEIKETATTVFNELKEVGQEVKEVATKSIKEVAEKVDFSESVQKVKATAKNVNNEIKEVATEITADVKAKSKELRETTTKLAKEALENIKLSDRLNSVKKVVVNTNEYALSTTEELIDSLEVNGQKWQNVTEKAIKSGLKLAEKQQDLVFSTLEAVKFQVGQTGVRFKKLFTATEKVNKK